MIKRPLIALIIFFSIIANAREIALTFDDCPRKTSSLMTGMERAKKLTSELKKAGVSQVAFFCNSPSGQPDGPERIRFFAEQGHLIANHTASHLDLNKTAPEEFIKDIERAHAELKDMPNFRKWFRFPYLREGKTPQTINAIRQYLFKSGYANGYVTIDNQDWYMDELLSQAIKAGRKFDQKKLCQTYSRLMLDEAEFYDNMSTRSLGRSVKHVLLLHETDLNALCLGELVAELKAKGWNMISPDEAYKDPIALREPSVHVPLNQGRVHALAKERSYTGPYFSKWNEEENIKREFDRAKVWKPKR